MNMTNQLLTFVKSPNRKNSQICVKSSLDSHKFTINIVVSKTIVVVPYANTYKTVRASMSTWSFIFHPLMTNTI